MVREDLQEGLQRIRKLLCSVLRVWIALCFAEFAQLVEHLNEPFGRNRIAWQRVRCSVKAELIGSVSDYLKYISTFSSAGRAPDS